MKKGVHPQQFLAKIKCACGQVYEIPSTKKEILVEICRNCSPVFTGKEETKPVIGRVERFLKKQARSKKSS
ncbi:MAG: 50S ribosomal protein L31 [Patescibacteria group bacterium]|nr:50S ribosomal protein L31 [Patescibacteria group bacterium]